MKREENRLRESICEHGRDLFTRGLAHGTAGNISVRLDDGFLITPTNSCLGRLDPAGLAKVDFAGNQISGTKASKEAFLHLLNYRRRPRDGAVVHLHSTHSVAVSCLKCENPDNVIPPLTAYYVMRVGRLPLVPYYPPGDEALAIAIGQVSEDVHAVLLANHGPIVSGPDLNNAVYAMEELEETAKLYLLLGGRETSPLSTAQVDKLKGLSK